MTDTFRQYMKIFHNIQELVSNSPLQCREMVFIQNRLRILQVGLVYAEDRRLPRPKNRFLDYVLWPMPESRLWEVAFRDHKRKPKDSDAVWPRMSMMVARYRCMGPLDDGVGICWTNDDESHEESTTTQGCSGNRPREVLGGVSL